MTTNKPLDLPEIKKKADVAEHPEVFRHVGLLFNQPPGTAGLPFNSTVLFLMTRLNVLWY